MKATLQSINQMQADGAIGKYAIGEAVGAIFYLEPFSTFDIDIFAAFQQTPGSSLISASPIYEYARAHHYEIKDEHILIEGWKVQFLPANDALHAEALEQANQTQFDGVPTWVIKPEHLMAIALRVGRLKDFTRIGLFVERKAYSADALNGILQRHGLAEKWDRFNQKYLSMAL